ncbi:MAG: Gfo/Idh/MocA family protein [Candidatus Hodarchaeota archaeon]
MIKVGIIGCGKIADLHAASIRRIPSSEIVGICDREELMAKQLSERFNIRCYFNDVNKLLEVGSPDIIHITTPPQSHFELGKLCLEAGCNVYMEKPFTLNTGEAEKLIKLATEKKLKITVGHNVQFTHAMKLMRELIKNGFLGGPPVHMDSYYCYDLKDVSYAKALLGDKMHWVRTLPGKLLHNIISHGISKIAEFLTNDCPKVIAHGFTSPLLNSINETDIIDELRVIIYDHDSTTAYFTFSSQMSPTLHQLRVYGPKNALIVDDDHQTLIKISGAKYKSYLDQFMPPYIYARQYLANSMYNIKKFIRRDFHNDAGMKSLIESFYHAVVNNTPLPITYREILLTSRIMDNIFSQLNSK